MQSGYAFLHFVSTPEGLRSAITAVEEGHLLVVDNITYQCKVTHSLQTQLMSMKKKEEMKQQEKKYLPSSLTHSLDDVTFQTYNSILNMSASPKIHSIVLKNQNSLDYECHEKDLSSYRMNTVTKGRMAPNNQSYDEVLYPRLNHLSSLESHEPSSSPFSQSFKRVHNNRMDLNDNKTDIIYPSFSVNESNMTISQDVFNYRPGRHFSSSLFLSSFTNSTYEHLQNIVVRINGKCIL